MGIKKRIIFLLSLLVTFPVFAGKVTPYKGSRIFWDTTSRKTVFSTGWYARIIELQDGRLMAACEHSGIDIAYSSNKGVSWSSPEKLVSNTNNTPNCVPDLIQLRDGTIIVAYNPRPSTPYTEDRRFGMRCKISTDNGTTWSSEINVYDASYIWDDGCWEPTLMELPDGEVQLYYSDEGPYTSSNEQNISVCRSFDGGWTWSAPDIVSFRSGYRDGMPCPIILKDQSEIVLTIEDNGWPGVGDFFPTTVRCPLETNWHNYYVDASSENREKTLDFSYCPNATGGAPYLRMLPWGETVMSYQSAYNHNGKLNMYVALGDSTARNFKSMQHPFRISDTETVMWNSLCVIDTGVVVAVGGVNNSIELIKGYALEKLQAPFGRPSIDGKLTRNEGYYNPTAQQIQLGVETGTRMIADFAYDNDSLYFIARVTDKTQKAIVGSYGDGVTLELDYENESFAAPSDACRRFFLRLYGTYDSYIGSSTLNKWTKTTIEGIRQVVGAASAYYIIEAAIPWSALGVTSPQGKTMRANVICQNRGESTTDIATEGIVDANRDKPYTWMDLYLQPSGETGIKHVKTEEKVDVLIRGDKVVVVADTPVAHVSAYSLLGRQVATSAESTIAIPDNVKGAFIVKVVLQNGKSVTKKFIR